MFFLRLWNKISKRSNFKKKIYLGSGFQWGVAGQLDWWQQGRVVEIVHIIRFRSHKWVWAGYSLQKFIPMEPWRLGASFFPRFHSLPNILPAEEEEFTKEFTLGACEGHWKLKSRQVVMLAVCYAKLSDWLLIYTFIHLCIHIHPSIHSSITHLFLSVCPKWALN